ncbi:MAG: hypothetical protein GY943_16815 [Chloroflexi bacterium]|nr:hypothetical protein [Chloroflexota bacterium]
MSIFSRYQHKWIWFFLGTIGALMMAGWVWMGDVTAVSAPIIAPDLNQHRENVILPIPNGKFSLLQTFVSKHDGLQEIEVMVSKSDVPMENGRLTFILLDSLNRVITQQTFLNSSLAQNQPLRLRFTPIPDSHNKRFTFQIEGDQQNVVSLHGYDLDVIANGTLSIQAGALSPDTPITIAQDLRLSTYYRLTWGESWQILAHQFKDNGALWLVSLLLLPLPGCLILLLGQSRWPKFDRAAWWGTAVALGTATWPLIWFALTLLNGHWSKTSLWATLIIGWSITITIWAKKRVQASGIKSPLHPSNRRLHTPSSLHSSNRRLHTPSLPHYLTISLLLLTSFAARLLAIRDITFPLWVDASRHALITAVMHNTGRVITDYVPFLPVDQFPYHFGFHTLSTSLALMTERPLPHLLLTFGQLLNAVVPLSVYTAVWLMTRQRRTGLIAAFLVAFPFFFPGYYATWGRFTQLTGMIILPVLVGLTWQLLRGGKRWRGVWWLVAILAAGLFLMHIRVFLIYLPFALVVWVMSVGRNGRYLFAAGTLTTLLIGIRAIQLFQQTRPATNNGLSTSIANYNAFPNGYVEVGWERYYIWVAAGLLVVVLTAVILRYRWRSLPLALIGWVGLLFLLLSDFANIPKIMGVININSMYITLFFPLAVYLSHLFTQLQRTAKRLPITIQGLLAILAGAGFCALFLFGVHQQITILNEQTILAYPADLDGLKWIDDNLPDDAKIGVNSWKWLGNTYAGADGGAWIVQLTGRESTTPPADYIYNREYAAVVNGFNETAVTTNNWSTASSAQWLRDQGVTHIYVGAKGGFFDPSILAHNPEMQQLYAHDGVFIFKLK